jgi:hypothetical protein
MAAIVPSVLCPKYKYDCQLTECVSFGTCKYAQEAPSDIKHAPPDYYCSPSLADQYQCKTTCGEVGHCIGNWATEFKSATAKTALTQIRRPPDYLCSEVTKEQEKCMMDCAHLGRCVKNAVTNFARHFSLTPSEKPASYVESMKNMPAKTAAATKLCHYGLTHIGDCGKARIWLGKETAVGRRPRHDSRQDFKLIVSLIEYGTSWSKDTKGDEFLVTGNAAAKDILPPDLFRADKPIPFLHVSWPDFGTVKLGRDWWASFVSALQKIDGDVVLYCMGGHGRTGTAASILAVLCGWVQSHECPVQWIRDNYCHEVVESSAQIKYIEEITNRKVESVAAKNYGYTTYDYTPTGVATTSAKQGTLKLVEKGPAKPYLSKNKYKKEAAAARRKGQTVPTLAELQDGNIVTYGGNSFCWDAEMKEFFHVEAKNGVEGNQTGTTKPCADSTTTGGAE